MKTDNYILLDLGGTNLRLAKTPTLDPVVLASATSFTLSHNLSADFAQLTTSINSLSAEPITAIGMATAGQLDTTKHTLIDWDNFPEWVGMDIYARLVELFACPVFIDNDAVAAALGEVSFEGERTDFMLAIWGTGVGGATVRQVPQLQVEQIDWPRYLKDIEARCGGNALAKRFSKPPVKLSEAEWASVGLDFLQSIKKLAQDLGHKRIICGGGVALKQQERLQRLIPEVFVDGTTEFAFTRLGENFGLYGAAALIRQNSQ